MENREFTFTGTTLNGIAMLVFNLLMYVVSIALIVMAFATFSGAAAVSAGVGGAVLLIANMFVSGGFMLVEPGEARVMMFFGKYRGTFTQAGYFWVNPFFSVKIVRIQADAALRQVAGRYAYDNDGQDDNELTLRGGSDEINEELEQKIDERLAMAGIEVIEARINYLAYAPEIAAVMLRRQQATAVISAREKIVEGAVSMVKMALDKLADEDIIELDEEKKAAMVSNLLVVLCGDDTAQPVINTGTLNH